MTAAKSPLVMHVVWHPEFTEGLSEAQRIYSFFSRDVDRPFETRGIGIPVLLWPNDPEEQRVDFTAALRTAIIVLVDSQLVADDKWQEHLGSIAEERDRNSSVRLYLFAFDESVRNLRVTGSLNYCRLYDEPTIERRSNKMIHVLSHETCRFLYDMERPGLASPSPVALFISHAKKDGGEMAEKVRAHVASTSLKPFFDALDIAVGYKFPEEIEGHIKDSVFLALHSDAYASREWCRKEVLLAKRHNRPIVVVNILKDGEERSFPYMANVQTVRVTPELGFAELERIVTCALREALRFKYQELLVAYVVDTFGLDPASVNVISYPPELLSLASLIPSKPLVVYPEPPLCTGELHLLEQIGSGFKFLTSTMLPSALRKQNRQQALLQEMKIAISISESQSAFSLGLGFVQLRDAMIEIARYLLACGATLAYGGDVNYSHPFNFVEVLQELHCAYNETHSSACRIENYVANHIPIDAAVKARLLREVNFISVPELSGANHTSRRVVESANLTQMRRTMTASVSARVILGGKTTGFKGRYPGIIEEAYLALEQGQPVYLLGAFGGAARAVIECLQGKSAAPLTLRYHLESQPYAEFWAEHTRDYPLGSQDCIDYDLVHNLISSKGVDGLRNGLTPQENAVLFETTDMHEAVALILKGLASVPC